MIKKQCSKVGCHELIPRNVQPPLCGAHQKQRVRRTNRSYDRYRRDPVLKAFYSSKRWQRFRLTVLKEHFYICSRQLEDCSITADTVHHLIEVNTPAGWERRFDRSSCEPVCRTCHNKIHKKGVLFFPMD